MPKRIGMLWESIQETNNVRKGVRQTLNRRRQKGNWGKAEQYIEDHFNEVCQDIERSLKKQTYDFGNITHRLIKERKKIRAIDYLDTYHSIYLQCVMNICQDIFISRYIKTTYSSIKGRGLVQMSKQIRRVIKHHPNYHFMLIDMKKCYENADHEQTLKAITHIIKDKYVIEFFERLIALLPKGVAIGFSTNHYVVNLLFNALDHRVDKLKNVYFFRYMDDILIIAPKELLPTIYQIVQEETEKIKQIIKPNTRFAPIDYGIPMCGYKYFSTRTLLKKDIVKNMYAKDKHLRRIHASDEDYKQGMASYWGWCKYCNGIGLFKAVLKDKQYLFKKQFDEMKHFTDIATDEDKREQYEGEYWKKADIIDKEVEFIKFRKVKVKGKDKYIIQARINETCGYFFTEAIGITDKLERYQHELPFAGTIKELTNKKGQKYMTII